MKRVLLCATMSAVVMSAMAVVTPDAVNVFYRGMKTLAETRDANAAAATELEMQHCFMGQDNSGLNLPNDFRFFDVDKESLSHRDSILTSNNYVGKLRRFLNEERCMKVTFDGMVKNELGGRVPDMQQRGERSQAVAYVVSFVNKTYTTGAFKKSFNDTVYTYNSSGKIGAIFNGAGRDAKVDVNLLKINAAKAYEQERYYDAYRFYEQIIAAAPRDAESFYYIGLMTYWGQGCKKNKKKAIEYVKTARSRGISYIRDKAKHALTMMSYGGSGVFH